MVYYNIGYYPTFGGVMVTQLNVSGMLIYLMFYVDYAAIGLSHFAVWLFRGHWSARAFERILTFIVAVVHIGLCLLDPDLDFTIRYYPLESTRLAQMTVNLACVAAGIAILVWRTSRSLWQIIYELILKYPFKERPFMYWTPYMVGVEVLNIAIITGILFGSRNVYQYVNEI